MNNDSAYAHAAHIATKLKRTIELGEKYFRAILPGAGKMFDNSVKSLRPEGLPGKAAKHFKLAGLPAQAQRELTFALADSMVLSLWKQGHVVYEIDPDTWSSIGEADTSTLIPGEILTRLPHPNPLLVFPEPILIDHGEEVRQRLVGVYVVGVQAVEPAGSDKEINTLCSTHDPRVAGWSFQFAGMVEDQDGKPVIVDEGYDLQDIMWTRTSVRLTGMSSLGVLTRQALDRFDAISGDQAFGDHRQDVPLMLKRAVNALVYLCTENADLRPIEATATRRTKHRPGQPKPPAVIMVGFRVGTQLRAWKKYEQDHERTDGTGGKKAPHIRRAHAHTYRVGKGRSDTIIRWLWPIEINMNIGDDTPTVVPLKVKNLK